MALDFTTLKATINDIKRNLFFEETVSLKIYKVNTLLLEITEGWYMSKKTKAKLEVTDPVSGTEEYYVCSIVDTEDDTFNLEGIIPSATSIVIGGNKYAIDQYNRPRALTKEWKIRLGSVTKA